MIPYGHQDINQADIDAVVEVLKSDLLTQGTVVPHFEKILAAHVRVKHALAVNSATSALHIACMSLGLGPSDWLWTSPITFVASANCALYCGARVNFVDIDPRSYNICPLALEEALIRAEKSGTLPKILVVVHFSGQPCDMRTISKLSRRYDFKVIEDASHAIGGKYKGEFIGNCRYSDITVFSFHPVKIITTGEGGMAVTNSDVLADKMRLLRSHGITRDVDKMSHEPDGPWYYQQISIGFNYRMTELQGALGVSQISRLDKYVARRHEIAEKYDQMLAEFPLSTPWQHPDGYSGMHLYVIRLNLNMINKTHLQIFENLRWLGIGVNLHYIPVHLQPHYKKMGFKYGDFPQAEKYYAEAISLPMFQTMTDTEQEKVIDALSKSILK